MSSKWQRWRRGYVTLIQKDGNRICFRGKVRVRVDPSDDLIDDYEADGDTLVMCPNFSALDAILVDP